MGWFELFSPQALNMMSSSEDWREYYGLLWNLGMPTLESLDLNGDANSSVDMC